MSDDAPPPTPDRPARRWPIIGALAIAVLLAAFTGFRIPNTWATTLQTISLMDGFQRRFLVGTILRPFAVATDYNYWLFATFSFVVLAAFLVVLVLATVRTRVPLRKLLVIAWLLLPTGGFLFHTVGYFEHVLYLMLFGALWLVHRGRATAATCVMVFAPCVHEIAVLTVIPIFGLALAYAVSLRRAVVLTAIPLAVGFIVLAIAPYSGRAIDALVPSLLAANFELRWDALQIFDRTHAQSRALYDLSEQIERVVPTALLLVGSFVAFSISDRFSAIGAPTARRWHLFAFSCLAIGLPAMLILGGWDSNRWVFFLITNLFVVLWMTAGARSTPELRFGSIAVLVTTAILVSRVPLYYFDRMDPRLLGYPEIRDFGRAILKGRLFKIPKG